METITTTAAHAVAALGVFQKLMAHPFGDIMHSLAIARACAALQKNSEVAAVEVTRQKLVERFGKKDEGGTTRVPPENLYDFAKGYERVSSDEVQIQMKKVPIAALASAAEARLLTPGEVAQIEPFITE